MVPALPPLILTLEIDPAAAAFFDDLRQQHFPPERNFLAAHLTLFHKLPGEHLDEIAEFIREVAGVQGPIELSVTGLRPLGGGVAYDLASSDLTALRQCLAARWKAWLSRQDLQGHRPHITVQNKVTVETARTLLEALQGMPVPETVTGTGLILWRYLEGPWSLVERYPFSPID